MASRRTVSLRYTHPNIWKVNVVTFSERYGFIDIKAIQLGSIDRDLRVSLWNKCARLAGLHDDSMVFRETRAYRVVSPRLFEEFLKQPIEDIPATRNGLLKLVSHEFLDGQWFRVYDLIEFFYSVIVDTASFAKAINRVLEAEKSGYRLLEGKIVPITDQAQLDELEAAVGQKGAFEPAAEHIRASTRLYADRKKPDYRNSVKEAISAVESAAKVIAGSEHSTLGDAIKRIEKKHGIHPAFKDGVLRLYGYTNDQGGIRHSLIEADRTDEIDSRFMLISCSAFVNFLISRYAGVV
jgi:hypothetical protein